MHRLGVTRIHDVPAAAIESVYRSRYISFLGLGYALLGNTDQARDAVQETFATALRARSSFRGDGSLDGWLWQTMLNVCRQEHRRRARFADADPPELSANGHASEWPELRAAVAALPDRERTTVFLHYYAELTHEEAAEALGVQPGTVAAALNHARSKLRRALETEVTP